jgi:hypothetical protein
VRVVELLAGEQLAHGDEQEAVRLSSAAWTLNASDRFPTPPTDSQILTTLVLGVKRRLSVALG